MSSMMWTGAVMGMAIVIANAASNRTLLRDLDEWILMARMDRLFDRMDRLIERDGEVDREVRGVRKGGQGKGRGDKEAQYRPRP